MMFTILWGRDSQKKPTRTLSSKKLQKLGLGVEQQKSLPIFFEGERIGEQIIDLVVGNLVRVEIKAVQSLSKTHESQILGYLKNTKFELGLLINFGDRVEFKRFIYSY
jgi:GxxExxY protein